MTVQGPGDDAGQDAAAAALADELVTEAAAEQAAAAHDDTGQDDDLAGVLRDIHGNPFYLSLVPAVGSDGAGWIPGVEIHLNGADSWVHSGTSWRMGVELMRAAGGAQVAAAPFPGSTAAVVCHIQGLPSLELGITEATSVAQTMMGAAVSAVHDSVIWRHLIREKGFTAEEAESFLKGIETLSMIQFLESDQREI